MNSYEQKQQQRKERYEARAEAARVRSDDLYERGSKALSAIPFGQPILVGHHSERRDKNYRAKHRRLLDKSFEESNKTDYYAQKAESVGTGGISSDNPDAIRKLKEKLCKLTKSHEAIKAENKKRAKVGKERLPRFMLANSSANIRRIKQRIQQLEARDKMEVREDVIGNGWRLTEDRADNRIRFIFNGKPCAETRSILKSRGFRWSPKNVAWQRMLNNAGRFSAKMVIEELSTK